jgi:hypothetical protein
MMKSDLKNVSRHIEFVAEGPREMMCLPKKNKPRKPPQTVPQKFSKIKPANQSVTNYSRSKPDANRM